MFTFYNSNFVNSTSVNTVYGSATTGYLCDHNSKTKWEGVGAINTQTTLLTVSLASGTSSEINVMLINHNLQRFLVTAIGYPWITSTICSVESYNGNNTQIQFPYISGIRYILISSYSNTSSVTPYIGELIVSKGKIVELLAPTANNFNESSRSIGIQRQMSDGGVISIRTSKKYSCNFTATYVPSTTYSELFGLWESNKDFIFAPFPNPIVCTTGSTYASGKIWNGQADSVNWAGDFNAKYKDNNTVAGYTVPINLMEIPS